MVVKKLFIRGRKRKFVDFKQAYLRRQELIKLAKEKEERMQRRLGEFI